MATLDLLPLAERMIAFDTRSSVSNTALIEFLLPLCRLAGLETHLQEEIREGVKQHNLLASRGPLDRDTLLLATHTDTVPPGDESLWTATDGDPFALTRREGLLYGLGTADVKLDLLCKLLALESIRDVDLERNVALAATYGEETGRYGAKLLVQAMRDRSSRGAPRRILVGEPTQLRPCTAHKGYVEFHAEGTDLAPRRLPEQPLWRLVFAGIAAHSSQPSRGSSANTSCLDALTLLTGRMKGGMRGAEVVSVHGGDAVNKVAARCEAVVAAAGMPDPEVLLTPLAAAAGVTCAVEPTVLSEDAVWSPDLAGLLLRLHSLTQNLERELRPIEAQGFDPPWSTVNNGRVDLGQAHLSYVVDVRRIPAEVPGEAIDIYEAKMRALGAPEAVSSGGTQLRIDRALESTPFQAFEDSSVLTALVLELGRRELPLEREIKSGTTEAPVYQEAGMDAIVFGPGQAAGNIHKPNEHVPLADLERCIEVYRDVVIRLCGARA